MDASANSFAAAPMALHASLASLGELKMGTLRPWSELFHTANCGRLSPFFSVTVSPSISG